MASTVARSEQWEYWTQRGASAAEFDAICVTRRRKAVHAPYPRCSTDVGHAEAAVACGATGLRAEVPTMTAGTGAESSAYVL